MTNVQCSSPPILWKPRTQITDNMICASDAGKSACLGDTGGPLVTNEGKYYSVFVMRSEVEWFVLSLFRDTHQYKSIYSVIGYLVVFIPDKLVLNLPSDRQCH